MNVVDSEFTLAERFALCDAKRAQGNWFPACNGTETPYLTRTGRRLLYVYQPSTGKHAYLDTQTDLILSDDESEEAHGRYL